MSATETHAAAMRCASIPSAATTVAARMASSAIRSSDVNKYKWDYALIPRPAFAAALYLALSIIPVSITNA